MTDRNTKARVSSLAFLVIVTVVLLVAGAVFAQEDTEPPGVSCQTPVWSPDGTKIAYSADSLARPAEYDIYVLTIATGAVARLTTSTSYAEAMFPAWSPDGTKIAYGLRQGDRSEIWVMNADGTGKRQLTHLTSRGMVDEKRARGNTHPAWSPDGTKIAYVTMRGQSSDVVIMTATGHDIRYLAASTTKDETSPSWSPDGLRLVYSGDQGLWVRNADASGAHRITTEPTEDDDDEVPDWAAVGGKIVFRRESMRGNGSIMVVNADGTDCRALMASPPAGLCLYPAWSPDASKVVFVASAVGGTGQELWVVNAAGGQATQLTHLND